MGVLIRGVALETSTSAGACVACGFAGYETRGVRMQNYACTYLMISELGLRGKIMRSLLVACGRLILVQLAVDSSVVGKGGIV